MTTGFRRMDKNDQVSHMKTLSDDVLRKIGPNVLLFQATERLLKLLIANHRADGTTIDFLPIPELGYVLGEAFFEK